MSAEKYEFICGGCGRSYHPQVGLEENEVCPKCGYDSIENMVAVATKTREEAVPKKTLEERVEMLEEQAKQVENTIDVMSESFVMAAKRVGENASEIDDAKQAVGQFADALTIVTDRLRDTEVRLKRLETRQAFLKRELNDAMGKLGKEKELEEKLAWTEAQLDRSITNNAVDESVDAAVNGKLVRDREEDDQPSAKIA